MKQQTTLKLLKAGENIFLTGSAGAGKTYTLNQYIDYLKIHRIPVAITASTGIAATHMNGMTIHTWAGIGIKDHLSEQELKRMKERKYLREHLENVKVLIIDEISMLHAKQFNLVNQVLKYFKGNHEPFGGIQIVVCGDFFQLPPVGKSDETNRDKFCFMSSAWVEAKFKVCYITEQYRQGDDPLNDILNAIRQQNIQPEHLQKLYSAQYHQLGDTYTRLYTHNANVDSINQQYLNGINHEEYNFQAEYTGNEKLIETLKSSVRASEILVLKKNAKVMFVKNNFEEGYINGSLGEIVDFVEDNEKGLLPKVRLLLTGEELLVEKATWSIENEDGDVLASCIQIPLRLAWAITIHKSQGMTLDYAEIDLTKTFEKGQGYVALSRLRSFTGLRLLGFQAHALELDSLAVKADKRFQELSAKIEKHFFDEDLSAQHLAFIRQCGGIINPKEIQRQTQKIKQQQEKKLKINTFEQTKILFEQGFNIVEIADERGLSVGTIIGHLEKLHHEYGFNIDRVKPEDKIVEQVRKILNRLQKLQDPKDFTEDGKIKLRPIVELSSGLNYHDVRLALLFVY